MLPPAPAKIDNSLLIDAIVSVLRGTLTAAHVLQFTPALHPPLVHHLTVFGWDGRTLPADPIDAAAAWEAKDLSILRHVNRQVEGLYPGRLLSSREARWALYQACVEGTTAAAAYNSICVDSMRFLRWQKCLLQLCVKARLLPDPSPYKWDLLVALYKTHPNAVLNLLEHTPEHLLLRQRGAQLDNENHIKFRPEKMTKKLVPIAPGSSPPKLASMGDQSMGGQSSPGTMQRVLMSFATSQMLVALVEVSATPQLADGSSAAPQCARTQNRRITRADSSDLIWLQRRNCSAVCGSSTVPNGHVRETATATISREPGNYYIGTQGM
jgi:hypothetical protein